jgi:serine protease AprX
VLLVVSTSHPAQVVGSSEDMGSVAMESVDVDVTPLWIEPVQPVKRLASSLAEVASTADADTMVDVIVTYTSVSAAQGAEPPADGTRKGRRLTRLPFQAMRVPVSSLNTVARGSNVRYVSPDSEVLGLSSAGRQTARTPGSYTVPYSNNTAYQGNNVNVAVIDTGVHPHADLQTLIGQRDFVNGAAAVPMSQHDGFGHGTHVAGMIGGTGLWSYNHKYQGVGTAANVLALRVLDDDGRGNVSDVINALDWIIDVGRTTYGIRVANLSLGKGVEEAQALDPLVQAVDALWDAGVVVVVSAGNFGQSGHFTVASPGNSRKVITVGSVTDNGSGSNFSDDYVSSYSSRGPTLFDHVLKPDLIAPGNKIIAPYAEGAELANLVGNDKIVCGYNSGTNCSVRYLKLSGTSMAAGLVSGAVARMIQKDPSLTPNTVKARLMKSARKMTGSDPTETGAGVLNVDAAMNATGVLNVPALSPLMQLSTNGDLTYVQDTAQLWGNTQWAAGNIWATGYLWTDAASMGAYGYLWSNSYLWSNNHIWGNSFLWTNGFLWSDAVKPASVDVQDPGEEEPEEEEIIP